MLIKVQFISGGRSSAGEIIMSRFSQKKAVKGSQKWLQEQVNSGSRALDTALLSQVQPGGGQIEWLSPLADDEYAEYSDGEFLQLLSLSPAKRRLESFWPHGGPEWDGLACTDNGSVILLEAKSHITELKSDCKAKEWSMELIDASLNEASEFYGAVSSDNWTEVYYQYANRLAHLYLLRHLNGIRAWLVFLYFVNDIEMKGPESVEEWREAIKNIHEHLGLTEERLAPYVIDIFYDVEKKAVLKG